MERIDGRKEPETHQELTQQEVRDKLKAIQLSHSFLNVIFHQVGSWNLPGLQTECIFFLACTFHTLNASLAHLARAQGQHTLLHSKEGSHC
jgi:hypothetical protein